MKDDLRCIRSRDETYHAFRQTGNCSLRACHHAMNFGIYLMGFCQNLVLRVILQRLHGDKTNHEMLRID